MKWQWPWVWRTQLIEMANSRDIYVRDSCKLGNELSAVRSSAHGESIAHAREVLALNEKLAQSSAIVSEKQREIAYLRTTLGEKDEALKEAIKAAAEERHKLMDWIAKGVSNGVPIFAEIPAPVVAPDAPKPPTSATEHVPTEVEEAVNRVGRRARAIVKHIEKKNDIDFEAAMKGAGVTRIFDEDKAVAEAEAVAISETRTA